MNGMSFDQNIFRCILGWADAMEILIKNGSEINKKNIYGKTPLQKRV